MTIDLAVIGSGYVWSVVAACFDLFGNEVLAVEIDDAKRRALEQGRAPFYEAGLIGRFDSGIRAAIGA